MINWILLLLNSQSTLPTRNSKQMQLTLQAVQTAETKRDWDIYLHNSLGASFNLIYHCKLQMTYLKIHFRMENSTDKNSPYYHVINIKETWNSSRGILVQNVFWALRAFCFTHCAHGSKSLYYNITYPQDGQCLNLKWCKRNCP